MLGVLYRGDTWEIQYQVSDKDNLPITNLEDWEIRCEIKGKDFDVKLANNKVNGGSEQQIKVLDDKGNIGIIVNKEDTDKSAKGIYEIEIEITSPTGKRFTIKKDTIEIQDDLIKWENK